MPDYVDWFVNRQKQRDGFLKMVARPRQTQKQIMLVQAPRQMGKTWLILHLQNDCRSASIPVARIDFGDRRAWDYLAIVREARDQLGPAAFNPLTEAINASTNIQVQLATSAGTGGANINVATGGGQISDSQLTVGDVAGRDIIKDNFFFIQTNNETTRQNIEVRITDAFLTCLDALQRDRVVACLFDTYDQVTQAADQWLQAFLLTRVRDGRLPNVVVVIAGRTVPTVDPSWQTGLDCFSTDQVAEYIEEKRKLTNLSVETLSVTTKGIPGLLGMLADNAAADSP